MGPLGRVANQREPNAMESPGIGILAGLSPSSTHSAANYACWPCAAAGGNSCRALALADVLKQRVERLQKRLERLARDLPEIAGRRREQLDAEKDRRIPLLRAKAKDASVSAIEAAAFAAKADELARKPTSFDGLLKAFRAKLKR
jgi:hypothetical protein